MVKPAESHDFFSVLGRILSSPTLLQEFGEDRERVLDTLNVNDSDREPLLSLELDQLKEQANTLVLKRWHEVQQLAPVTVRSLGDRGKELFRFFAATNWPEGHRRHVVDAGQFLEFLAANKLGRPNRAERRNLKRRQR